MDSNLKTTTVANLGNEQIKEIVCIICPNSCKLKGRIRDGQIISVENAKCPRGQDFFKKEMTDPTRLITTTVKFNGESNNRLPVKTENEINKKDIYDFMVTVCSLEILPPVKCGDIIARNLLGKNINLIATKTILK